MVIGPDELMKKITEDEAGKLEQLEKKIDDTLRKKYSDGWTVTFSKSIFGDLGECAIESLLSKYRKAGWSVQELSDFDDYYEFKKKEKDTYPGVPFA